MIEKLTFKSGGVNIEGTLFVPPDHRPGNFYPALVVDGPMTDLKEQVSGGYARRLAGQGFLCLAFDHRHYGESGGLPRQYESPTAKIEDIHNAVTFLRTRPDVDRGRLGGVGISAGGGYMAVAVATDKRISAFVSVAGAFRSTKMMKAWLGEDIYAAALRRSEEAESRYRSSGEVEYIPAVAPDPLPGEVALPVRELYTYYGTARGSTARYVNRFAVMGYEGVLLYDPQGCANGITVPSVFVHGTNDLLCPPGPARHFFERMLTDKEFYQLDTRNHIDLYDDDRCVDEAVTRVSGFLQQRFRQREEVRT